MKKITFLACLLSIAAYAQNDTAYSSTSTPQSSNNVAVEASVTRTNADTQIVIDTFTDLGDFNTAVADCDDSTLTTEDFSGGPGGITVCGATISATGDTCFPAATLEDGFTVTSSEIANPASVVNIPAGALANGDSLVGATTFAEFTIVTFDDPVYAAAFDIYNNLNTSTNVRLFNPAGDLIEEFTVTTPIDVQTFFGFYADEPVGSIEIEGASDSGELLGNFLFGAECSNLSVASNVLATASVFPNPTRNTITLNLPSSVEVTSISIVDITGKKVLNVTNTNTLNLSNLANGLYLMTAETTAGVFTQKVVKN